MHSLTICFGPTGTVWTLLFKDADNMKAAEDRMKTDPAAEDHFSIGDDYGQFITVKREHIVAVLREDLDQSQLAQVERGLHQARSQAKAQTRAMQDPVIKESLRLQQQGPAVMSPLGPRFS